MGGRPPILLDLPRREFTLFGTTFLPTDTLLFMLLFLSVGIAIFLVTALFGRVWCGWSCPQTVYMEFLFRPIERWLEGGPRGAKKLDRAGGLRRGAPAQVRDLRRCSRCSSRTPSSRTSSAIDQLVHWVQGSPKRAPGRVPRSWRLHDGGDLPRLRVVPRADLPAWPARTAGCRPCCFDRRTLIVGYDPRRGEPRMQRRSGPAGRRAATASTASCACSPARPASTSATGCRWSASTARSASTRATRSWSRIGRPKRPHPLHQPRTASSAAGRAGCASRVLLYPVALARHGRAVRLLPRVPRLHRGHGAARRGRPVPARRRRLGRERGAPEDREPQPRHAALPTDARGHAGRAAHRADQPVPGRGRPHGDGDGVRRAARARPTTTASAA